MFIGRPKKHPTGHADPFKEHVPDTANTETEQAATRLMAP